MDLNTLQQIISRVPVWHGAHEIQHERIAGLTNENYRITVDGEHFALRISGQNALRLGIDRNCELAALRSAAAAGIGPEVVAYLPPEGHLVTHWLPGYHWNVDEFRTPGNVRLLTDTVKCIHTLPNNGAVFSPFQRIHAFLEIANRYSVHPPPEIGSLLKTMSAIQEDQQNDPADWQRFCHNDMVCVNYLFNKQDQSIKVLDWEFAGMGDIYYDLATVVYTHDSEGPIPPDLEDVMLACYFGEITGWQRRRLLGMKYMLMFFTAAWGLAQHGMQQAGIIPAVQGFDYLEFARFVFDHDLHELQNEYELRRKIK